MKNFYKSFPLLEYVHCKSSAMERNRSCLPDKQKQINVKHKY